MDEAIALFREGFQIFEQRIANKPYAVRFIGPPYQDAESDSILVYGHGRNPDRLSPASIETVLTKFGLSTDAFKEKYNELYSERAGR